MLGQFQDEPFGCLKSFRCLRRGRIVIVGDKADARIAKFLFKSRVGHNWPSQWHTRYKAGYIEFENWKKFDLAEQTTGGKPIFLFLMNPEILNLWLRQTLGEKIGRFRDEVAAGDRSALDQLLREQAGPELGLQCCGGNSYSGYLAALSVPQLEAIAELLAMSGDDRDAAASPVAA